MPGPKVVWLVAVWCFTVRWLNRESTRSRSDTSLNLFEEDLADFEVYTGCVEEAGNRKFKRDRVIMPQPTSDQLYFLMDTMTLFPSAPPTGTSISELVRLGTSTWTYEGWKGQVYHKTYPKSRFKQDSLAEYADYQYKGERLFRTVGIRLRALACGDHFQTEIPIGHNSTSFLVPLSITECPNIFLPHDYCRCLRCHMGANFWILGPGWRSLRGDVRSKRVSRHIG